MGKLSFEDFEVGKVFDLGITVLNEDEIIEFARQFDPLDFHINKEAAEKSHFGGLVASGAHIFTKTYRDEWLPLFKETVLAGLEINTWKFLKPIYAGTEVYSAVRITDIKPNPEKRTAVVTWDYNFKEKNGELLQTVNVILLHSMMVNS